MVCVVVGVAGFSSSRIVQSLVEAGADAASAFPLMDRETVELLFKGTPLAFTNFNIRAKKVEGKDATESQLHTQPGGLPAVADEDGGRPCGLLAVGERHALRRQRCYRGFGQSYQVDFGPADVDAAHLEEKGWKAQGALGCHVQVGGDEKCFLSFLLVDFSSVAVQSASA